VRGEAAAQFLAVDNEHGSTALQPQPPDDVVALLIAASSTMTEHGAIVRCPSPAVRQPGPLVGGPGAVPADRSGLDRRFVAVSARPKEAAGVALQRGPPLQLAPTGR
jgi:hypothetical protein